MVACSRSFPQSHHRHSRRIGHGVISRGSATFKVASYTALEICTHSMKRGHFQPILPVECLPARSNVRDPPCAAVGQASKLSADHVLQHRLVERQIRHDLLQLAVLFLELAQPFHLRWRQASVLLASIVVGRLANPRLATDLAHRRVFLSLPQNEGNLRLRKLRSFHDASPSNGPNHSCR